MGFPSAARTASQPPQGGRLDVRQVFANLQSRRMSRAPKLLISPLAGEMPGRAEGGVKERNASG
ncbi:MAG: hypothetical protein EOS38_21315 [Mesorhizobium sp.]|nr:hypothetical protein EOA38_04770 [Mesorhizobium sp. M1E.F.Ca.ET.041.01.1.1]RWD86535.1 MAG: hypothetical protein EOS38_21315 [Mesorhizobium sp.]